MTVTKTPAITPPTGTAALNEREAFQALELDALKPFSSAVVLVFLVFIPFNLLDLPSRAVVPVVVHDICLVSLAGVLRLLLARARIPAHRAAPVGALLGGLVISNILLTFHLTGKPFYTLYVGIVLIAMGTFLLSRLWIGLAFAAATVAWAPIAMAATDSTHFTHYAFTLFASIVVAVAIHLQSVRVHRRVVRLRQRESMRQTELELALEAAEQARRDLDRRVEERTAALSEANRELRGEMEERRRMEQERAELEGRLQHAQKMESIGRLAGGVAHDFNNVLTIIDGQVQLARRLVRSQPELAGLLDEASSAVNRAAEMTRQLLAFSRRQIMRPRVFNPNQAIEGIRKMIQRAAGETIKVDMDLSGSVHNIHADPGQMEQVVMNLVINACDAMADGGTLRIRLNDVEVDEEHLRGREVEPGEFVLLTVSDSGIGMDEETRDSIFEPFFTTKEVGKGTGLGLSMVDGIVSQHGGYVEVESAPGQGSTFHVYLPRSTASPRRRRHQTDLGDVRPGDETILVVEDADAVRQLAVQVLRSHGYRVLEAADGEEALQVADQHDGPIHLLITDVIMPELDGGTLAKRLAARREGLKVLFASGYSDDRIAKHGVLEPGVHFLPKPYKIDALARTVRNILQS